jgi:D-alanyl-D-alanine carboxypeptidase
LRQIAGLTNYSLRSANNSRYNQTIKNTDKLLASSSFTMLGAKTGYLNESQYNFAALLKTPAGQELAVVVLGEQHLYSAFAETSQLAALAQEAQGLALINGSGQVLGLSTSTIASTISALGGSASGGNN